MGCWGTQPSLGVAVAPALLWVTALHCAARLLSARLELPQTATSPGLMQMLNFLQLPENHQQENMLQEAVSVGETPRKGTSLVRGRPQCRERRRCCW